MYQIVIKNGMVYDGTGNAPVKADIAVNEGKIVKIASQIDEPADKIIDAKGLAVSPGFIDIHSHSDTNFLEDDACESKIYQGVTTELAGQCGYTVFPCPKGKEDALKTSVLSGREHIASGIEEFMSRADKSGSKMAINLAYLIGHGALRAVTTGFVSTAASQEDKDKMAQLMDKEMADGAYGASLGLGYAPGFFADQSELNNIGAVVAKYDGVIMSHMRNQADDIFNSLEEMYEINRKTGCKVNISHLKFGGKKNYGHGDKLWQHIVDAQNKGIKVTADMYPYEASSSGITNILPKWSLEGGVAKAAQRFETEESVKLMESLKEQFQTEKDGRSIFIVSTYGQAPYADGKDIYEISQELGLSMPDAYAKVTVETAGHCQCVFFSIDIRDVHYLLKQDISVGSDGSAYPLDIKKAGGRIHPRNCGTFPCFLRLAREHGLCDLQTAIHRITKKSADIIGIKDRGLIKEGMAADITIFNGETIADNATYKDPFQKPTGLEYVIVNGEIALEQGGQTQVRAGKFMRRGIN